MTTPLILASAGGHTSCVLELLEQGADVNAKRVVSLNLLNSLSFEYKLISILQTGTTALFFAAQGGHLNVAKILLKAGALVDCTSVDGGTALFVACQGGHSNMVKELLTSGANANALMKVSCTL